MAARKRMFAAVFPTSTDINLPTPLVTPQLSSDGFGASFSSSAPESQLQSEDSASEKIRWNRAWHSATAFLTLPNEPITAAHSALDEEDLRGKWFKPCTPEISKAISYLVSDDSRGRQIRNSSKEDDLLEWYSQEAGRHYFDFVRPLLLQMLDENSESSGSESSSLLIQVLQTLKACQGIYVHPLHHYVLPKLNDRRSYELAKFRESFEAIVAKTLSPSKLATCLNGFLRKEGSTVLGLHDFDELEDEEAMEQDEESLILDARRRTETVAQGLHDVGLGGAHAQRQFAEVMSDILTTHVKSSYAGQWTSPSSIVEHLKGWVENDFARFVVQVLARFTGHQGDQTSASPKVTLTDVGRWQDMAIQGLGALRIGELFDVIVDWENNSRGAVEDLKHYITTTTARTHLTTVFSQAISQRLLQPGASTTQILQVYICIIRAFAVLDPKGVLLDRIARPIRRYLRERDDAVKIIVGGLLSDVEDADTAPEVLIELAVDLNKLNAMAGIDDDDGELDWDDMSWMPDPIDAGPDYKKSKTSDVIGTLIGLFDTKDIFVKEFQNIMGERLLKKEFDFEKEIRVLELLKLRFGDSALQSCEVMLRDILDSVRVDNVIRKDQALSLDSNSQPAPELHTKILSRLFWPALHSESFSIPPEIHSLQTRYSAGFETLKQTRKLTWLQALGQVTVELNLRDRDVVEEVQTWQASLIYAFHEPNETETAAPATRTVSQLMSTLNMEEPLVRNALTFWVGKLVLKETSSDTYTVLETLSSSDLSSDGTTAQAAIAAAAADAATSSAAAAVRSDEDVAMEKMAVFWKFIEGMLTNQGSMPLQRIVMMLKFAVPGGFPFGNEELKEFLGRRVQEGKLELVGGNYKIVK